MKAPSPVHPEHAAAPGLCDADPEYQIFVVLFTGRSRCVRVRACWGVQKLAVLVSEVSEVPTQKFYLTCDGTALEAHPAQLASLIRHAQTRAEEVRQPMGEESWVRVTTVPPAPNETGT